MKDNPGTFILNPSPAGDEASVLVTGLGRSGTTMVSRVLSALGLFMGERVSKGTNEDKDFRNIIKSGSLGKFKKLCRERDEQFKRWGFKYPAARHNLVELTAAMRSPRARRRSRPAGSPTTSSQTPPSNKPTPRSRPKTLSAPNRPQTPGSTPANKSSCAATPNPRSSTTPTRAIWSGRSSRIDFNPLSRTAPSAGQGRPAGPQISKNSEINFENVSPRCSAA